MITLRLKKQRISTVLTACDAGFEQPMKNQEESIESLASFPKVFVVGPECKVVKDGVRHYKTEPNPTIYKVLGQYMASMPGTEVCILTAPDVIASGDGKPLLDYVHEQNMELAWACRMENSFIMTAPVVAHIMNEIGSLTFSWPWVTWMDVWMKKIMDRRYFDGTRFTFLRRLNPAWVKAGPEADVVFRGSPSFVESMVKPKKVLKIRRSKA